MESVTLLVEESVAGSVEDPVAGSVAGSVASSVEESVAGSVAGSVASSAAGPVADSVVFDHCSNTADECMIEIDLIDNTPECNFIAPSEHLDDVESSGPKIADFPAHGVGRFAALRSIAALGLILIGCAVATLGAGAVLLLWWSACALAVPQTNVPVAITAFAGVIVFMAHLGCTWLMHRFAQWIDSNGSTAATIVSNAVLISGALCISFVQMFTLYIMQSPGMASVTIGLYVILAVFLVAAQESAERCRSQK